jgi:hypothetical protein
MVPPKEGRVSRLSAVVFAGISLLAAGCGSQPIACERLPGQAVPIMASPHVPYVGSRHQAYDSDPPTSGPHLPWAPAVGVYEEPMPAELQVHALEHGRVLVQYASAAPVETVRAVRGLQARHPRDVLVAPDPRLRSGVALTAWGRIELLERPDPARMEAFVEALAGRYVHGLAAGARACPV